MFIFFLYHLCESVFRCFVGGGAFIMFLTFGGNSNNGKIGFLCLFLGI